MCAPGTNASDHDRYFFNNTNQPDHLHKSRMFLPKAGGQSRSSAPVAEIDKDMADEVSRSGSVIVGP